MPFHWCPLETEALMMFLASIPLIGLFFKRVHARWHAKWKTFCSHHDHKCDMNDCSMPDNVPHGKVGETQCSEHPLEVNAVANNDWDEISIQDVGEKFGLHLIFNLLDQFKLLQTVPLYVMVNSDGDLKVNYQNRTFIYDAGYHSDCEGINNYKCWEELLT